MIKLPTKNKLAILVHDLELLNHELVAACNAYGYKVDILEIKFLRHNIAAVASFKATTDLAIIASNDLSEVVPLQGMLDFFRVPYIGSKAYASAISFNKPLFKQLWQVNGLPTPPFYALTKLEAWEHLLCNFGVPVVFKPVVSGMRSGVSKITKINSANAAFMQAKKFGAVMAEPWIMGEEYIVVILGDQVGAIVEAYCCDPFDDARRSLRLIEDVSLFEREMLADLAVEAFHAVKASNFGIIKIIKDLNGDYWLIDLCLTTSFATDDLLVQALALNGYDLKNIVGSLLRVNEYLSYPIC